MVINKYLFFIIYIVLRFLGYSMKYIHKKRNLVIHFQSLATQIEHFI